MATRTAGLFLVVGLLYGMPFAARAEVKSVLSKPVSKAESTCAQGDAECEASEADCGDCGADCGPLQGWLGWGDRGFSVRGWVSQGFTYNAEDPASNGNFPLTFNDRANEYQMNQAYLILERPVAACGGWDVGGRVDLLYGTDYYFTTAAGLETHSDGSQHWNGRGPRGAGPGSSALYGLALPQAYAEIYAPVGGGVDLKLGHFYSPLGYEQVMAPENFFYSHSYALQYGEPKTFTGAMAEYQWNCNLSLLLGGTVGWNSFDSAHGQWGVLGGFRWTSSDDCTSLAWMVHTGDDALPGLNSPAIGPAAPTADNVTVYSLVFTRCLTERLKYVFQHDLGVEQNGKASHGTLDAAQWYGINQYLLYEVNDCWSVGCRFEWFCDEDHSRVVAVPIGTGTGGNYYALTLGGNWTPWQNVLFRPEIRWDWSDTEIPVLAAGAFDDFSADSQLTAAFDLIVRF
jgi:hypothetical protein